MAKDWVKVTWTDIKEKYDFSPHQPQKVKYVPWPVCRCGLIYLKNTLTQWCVSKGCNYELHPDYARKVKELGK